MENKPVQKDEVKLGFIGNVLAYLLATAIVTTVGAFILLFKGCRRIYFASANFLFK